MSQQFPFPFIIDSSIMAAFKSCPYKAYLLYIQHWKAKNESVHLVAGGAFAAGLEAARRAFYQDGVAEGDAQAVGMQALIEHYGDFEPPADSAKDLGRMCGALEFYFENYPMATDNAKPSTIVDGMLGIELSLAHPTAVNHPQTGDPILYVGRVDMVADFAGGLFIEDDKTTSSLGKTWGRQWDLRSQFTGYVRGCMEYGLKPTGILVRGVSILKTKYDTQQVITYRADWEVERWEDQLHRDLKRMIECWETGIWDYDLNHSCAEYGGCMFREICKHQDPAPWLANYYEQRVWDPQERKNLTLDEYAQKWGVEIPSLT